MAKLYIDTNILIYLLERHEHYSDAVANELESFTKNPEASLVTSAITATEFIAGTKSADLATLRLVPRLKFVPLDEELAEQAGLLTRRHSIQIGDAIHLATAIAVAADALFTNDKQLSRITGKFLPTTSPKLS